MRRGHGPAIIAMDLHRKSTTEHLVAYITTHHESLVALLPPDTTCADLFGEVENQRPIASFFSASEDAAVGRQLLRYTQMIGLWLVEERKKTKALQQRDKRDAQETVRKVKGLRSWHHRRRRRGNDLRPSSTSGATSSEMVSHIHSTAF